MTKHHRRNLWVDNFFRKRKRRGGGGGSAEAGLSLFLKNKVRTKLAGPLAAGPPGLCPASSPPVEDAGGLLLLRLPLPDADDAGPPAPTIRGSPA